MLLQADVSTRVLFLGTLFATKSTAWAAGVLLAAATRPRYAPLLYRGPGAHILQRFRSTFPAATVRIDALSARAAASRSAKFLARATGMNPADLAPAAAEATVAFRFVWPLWFPVQCWLMMRLWPWPGLSKENQAEEPADCNTTSRRTAKDSPDEKVQQPLDSLKLYKRLMTEAQ
eukprot:s554_g5.t1